MLENPNTHITLEEQSKKNNKNFGVCVECVCCIMILKIFLAKEKQPACISKKKKYVSILFLTLKESRENCTLGVSLSNGIVTKRLCQSYKLLDK